MSERNVALKIIAIAVLIGLLVALAVGCQSGGTQKTELQGAQDVAQAGPKVLFFTADW